MAIRNAAKAVYAVCRPQRAETERYVRFLVKPQNQISIHLLKVAHATH